MVASFAMRFASSGLSGLKQPQALFFAQKSAFSALLRQYDKRSVLFLGLFFNSIIFRL